MTNRRNAVAEVRGASRTMTPQEKRQWWGGIGIIMLFSMDIAAAIVWGAAVGLTLFLLCFAVGTIWGIIAAARNARHPE